MAARPCSPALVFNGNLANMAGIPHAMAILLSTFHKYAEKEGNSDTLTKKELIALLHAEIPGIDNNEPEVESLFSMLDNDKDGRSSTLFTSVAFQENI
ncbi:hypothetical protein INR49_011583 [Caranx melampygus]|nr:hypothetical protein INR49_011583 [Caranx melampygus]